jgi:HK97 family phage prohead protease
VNPETQRGPLRKIADMLSRALEVRLAREDDRSIRVVASDDSLDSYGTILEQTWNLERFRKSPVVFYDHNSWDFPIGYAEDVEVVDGRLEATIRFVDDKANPKAEQVWQLVRQKALRAVSVGFWPRNARLEMRDGEEVVVLSDNELFEISVTPLPSNPNAVASMRARAVGRADERKPSGGVPGNEVVMSKEVNKALGLPETATEADAVAAINELRACAAVSERSNPREALGVLEGYRAASQRVATLETELAALRDADDKRERSALIERGKRKLTPAMLEKVVPTWSTEQLRGFLETAPDVVPLGEQAREPAPPAVADIGARKFEEMAPIERSRLHNDNPDLYRALRADAEKRGAL